MREMAIELGAFIADATNGSYDLPPMQRTLHIGPRFSAKLMDSLYQGMHPGSMLFWEPPVRHRPVGGRYLAGEGRPRYWVLDGQQRGTAYVGAFGRRPNWIPEQQWVELGGPELEVVVRWTADGGVRFDPLGSGKSRYIRLSDLLDRRGVEDRALLEAAGFTASDTMVDRLQGVRHELLRYRLAVEWLDSDWSRAAENFVRRNPGLRAEERALCHLSIVCEELQREHIDVLAQMARRAGLGSALDRRHINAILQGFLPKEARRERGRWAEPDAVAEAVRRTEAAIEQLIVFLHGQGIVADALLWSHPVTRVLAALFDRFPEACTSSFTWHWLAHAAAGRFYPGGTTWARVGQDAELVLACSTFKEAKAVLYRHATPGGPPTVQVQDLDGSGRASKGPWGPCSTLYAMACTHQTAGPVVDLVDPSCVFPNLRMQPRRLWHGQPMTNVANRALLTEESAELVESCGGWGRSAFEEADVSPGGLAAHQLALPAAGVIDLEVEQQLKQRATALAEVINRFLGQIGPFPTPSKAVAS